MASIRKEITTKASVDQAWDALHDIAALHTRLVPGFVVDTRLEPGARIVTFGNGMVIREPIIDINDEERRVVWSAESDQLKHYNASAQVFTDNDGQTKVVWTADLLPNEASVFVAQMMKEGMIAMKKMLDALAV
jgi:hypothetical protein